MLLRITVDYTQKVGGKWRTYTGNVVARDHDGLVCYDPCGSPAAVAPQELPALFDRLRTQLGTDRLVLHVARLPDD